MGRIIDEYKESRLNALGPDFKDRLNALKNSPTDRHLANTVAREITARIDDVARLTKFFASPQGIKFAAKQGAIFQVANQDEKGRERLKSSGASVAKLIANTLKQAAVSGTGNRFVNPYLFPLYLGENNNLTEVEDRPDSLKSIVSDTKVEELVERRDKSDYYNNPENGSVNPIVKVEGTVDSPNVDQGNKPKSNLGKYRTSNLNSENIRKVKKDKGPQIISTKLKPKRGIKNTRGSLDFNPDTEEDKLITSEILDTPEYRDKDIIPFEFQILNPSNPDTPKYVYFRAYLDTFSDKYTGGWNSTKYIGRAEPLFNYEEFGRSIEFSFKIAATTRAELLPLYKKINHLVGTTAPSYNVDQTFMRGVISKVTIGDYLMQTPGFFTSIGLSWSKEYPWETGVFKVADSVPSDAYTVDSTIPKVPHILDVAISFTPIHNFNPQIEAPFITNTDILNRNYDFGPVPPVRPAEPINPPAPSQLIEDDLDALAFDLNNSTSNVTPSFPPTPVSREEQELEQAFLNSGINI